MNAIHQRQTRVKLSDLQGRRGDWEVRLFMELPLVHVCVCANLQELKLRIDGNIKGRIFQNVIWHR